MNQVELLVSGMKYAGWETIDITRSIESIAGSFSLSVSGDVPLSDGDRCQVLIDGQPVITGYIDDVEPDYDSQSGTTTVRGRDATGDLVDCALPSAETLNQTLAQVATAMCTPFGIKVIAKTDTGARFASSYLEPGMKCFELLSKLAGYRGLLLISDGLGGLVITKPGTARAPAALVQGGNIEAGRGTRSRRDRYSEYHIYAQASNGGALGGEFASEPHASVKDAALAGRYRPIVIVVEPESDLAARAAWERNVRAGRSNLVTHTVSGWYADGRTLWRPNTRVTVTDPRFGLDGTDRLITECTYTMDSQKGMRTTIKHLAPGAFDPLATPEPGASGW